MKKLLILDFVIFGIVITIIDTILAQQILFGINLYLSIALPILLVIYIRWHHYGLIMNLLVVVLHSFIFKAPWLVNLLHGLSFIFLVLTLFLVRLRPFKKRKIPFGYLFLLYVVLYSGLFLVEFILQKLFVEVSLLAMLFNHSLNIIVGLLILIFMYFQKDLIVNMNLYLQEESLKNIKDDGYGI